MYTDDTALLAEIPEDLQISLNTIIVQFFTSRLI